LADSENYNLVAATLTNDATTSFLVYFEMYKSDSKTVYTIAINCMEKKLKKSTDHENIHNCFEKRPFDNRLSTLAK
jgi:hypothetical protein